MPELLRMPEVATGAEEATVVGWPVAENQPFAAADVIVNVETAKAAVDVEAETDGVILRKLVAPGTDVQVGDPIALIGRPGETVADIDAELAKLGVESGANGSSAASDTAAPAPVQETGTAGDGTTVRDTESAAATPPAHGRADERVFASPLARRLAKEAGLDIRDVTGTGPGGRIVRDDVRRAIAQRDAAPAEATGTPPQAPPPVTPAPAPSQAVDQQQGSNWTETPHTKLRRLIATRLTESKATTPHFYLQDSVRVDRLLALRAELNEALRVRVSVNDLIVKAVAAAHAEVPDFNVIWTETGIRRFHSVDLGVAIASPKGLVTPVVTNVDRLSIGALATTTQDLARRAAEGQLRQAELEGGTCTVSNLGMFGVEQFTAIINPPQSSILAVGAARPEVDVDEQGEIRTCTKIRVVLSVDHRAIDGALAAQWMSAFRDCVETPLRLLG